MYCKESKNKHQAELHITADKREIKDFRKLLLATSSIRKTLSRYVIKQKRRVPFFTEMASTFTGVLLIQKRQEGLKGRYCRFSEE